MLIEPTNASQNLRQRVRPVAESITEFLFVVWSGSESYYLSSQTLSYGNGVLTGTVAFDFANGVKNGAKYNVQIYPVNDGAAIAARLGGLDRVISYKDANSEIEVMLGEGWISPEIYRGNVYINEGTESPYKLL